MRIDKIMFKNENRQLNFIDLFAGAGGLSEGFFQAGFNPIAHVEMNKSASKTLETRSAYYYLKKNNELDLYYQYERGQITRDELFSHIPDDVIKTVINAEMSPDTLPGIFEQIDTILKEDKVSDVDVIIGGPPCQAYSLVGRAQSSHMLKDTKNGLDACVIEACKPFYPPQLIIQDELHLISGPLGTIYGGYETIIEDMCCLEKNGKKIHPKYVVSTATIKNAGEQIKCLYARENYAQFPPSGFDTRDSYFIREVPLVSRDLEDLTENDIAELLEKGEKPFRQYVGICASGQSVKTTLIRLYSVLLQEAFILSEDPKYQNYVDPYYTLVGYFNSIRELGGAVRLLDDDINSRLKVLRKKYKNARQRFLGFDGKKEITSRIPSYQIAEILEKLAEPFDPSKERQSCYDVVIATNMIAVGMDVDRLGLMAVVGQPKQNSEYIQATSRVGRKYPGIIFTVYNPYRPRDLSNYENFVGFHSQMYRYVEGTTATPFAARARDRVLHALVVAMLRLQTETMAGNKGASNILSISDEELGKIKDQILERISIVAPMAYESASDDIDAFISTWKEIAKDENLYYFVTNTENNKRLLSYYGQPITGKEKPTLNSMRDVEQSSTVYLYEEGGAL